MKVNYDAPPPVRVLYQGGSLQSGQIPKYKKDLFNSANVRSYSGSSSAKISETASLGDDHFVGESTRKIMEGE